MRGNIARGIAAGALIGAAAGILLMPQMNMGSKNRFTGVGKKITGFTGDLWDGMKNRVRG